MKQADDSSFIKGYSSVKTFLGVASIACNLLLVWGLFLASWRGGAPQPIPTIENILWFIPFVFGLLLLANLPFDFVGGYAVERRAGRFDGSLGTWLLQWLKGGLGYAAMQTLGGYFFAVWIFGYGFAGVVIFLIPGIVAAARIWQFYLIPSCFRQEASWPEGYETALRGELKKLKEPWPVDLFLYRSTDAATVNGGRVGMGGHSRLMISDSSAKKLFPRDLAILILREERWLGWASGQKHFHYGLGWGLLGILLTIPGIALMELSGINAWLWLLASMTSWHGLGLIVLAGIARRQVLRADRELVNGDVPKREYVALLRKIQKNNRTPLRLSRVSELLFHSMPSLQTRLDQLDRI